MALEEYEAGKAFPGVVGRTTDESSTAWPRPLRAAAGMPNVLLSCWMTPRGLGGHTFVTPAG